MKILVTGANGYLGRGVVKELCSMGHSVVAADSSTDHVCPEAERYQCDLFGVENPYDFFGQPDVLLHMAWRDGFVHNSPAHIQDFAKHYAFLENMMRSGVRKVAVMGTMHEIGFFEGSVDENTPCNPMSLYGISKDALRKSVQLLAGQTGAAYQWLRAFYIVSSQTNGGSIFSKLAAAAQKGQTEFPYTTGQNQYDFLDYDDFCGQVAAAVAQDRIDGVINICSGRPEKLSDRVERFIKESGFSIKLQYGAFPDRPYDSKAIWGNDAKIRQILRDAQAR
jgi:dTDP-6-deoxy-L-talose 4-dehydrogenase (NAD+)